MNDIFDAKNSRQWAMFMHFSVFAGYLIPLGGLVLPIILWQLKKDQSPEIDQHGKNIVNFLISMIIYVFVSSILLFVFIGVFLLLALSIAGIVLPIIAAIKANNGEVWKYPFTIQIIK